MLGKLLRRLVTGQAEAVAPAPSPSTETTVSIGPEDFRARYDAFRQLLSANNNALIAMSAMEEALTGASSFGMTWVKSLCTRLSAEVFRVIQSLEAMTPGRHGELREVFKAIRQRMAPHLAPRPGSGEGPYVLDIAALESSHTALVGQKMAALAEASRQMGERIPAGFVVTVAGYRRFVEANELLPEIDRRIQIEGTESLAELISLSASLKQLIVEAPVPEDLAAAIYAAHDRLAQTAGREVRVVVRASATCDDMTCATYAGQYRSELNIGREGLLDAYREVLAGKFSVPAIAYRLYRGIRDESVSMAVACMEMLVAEAGGVAFSRDPLRIRADSIIISSAFGLAKTVVDGIDDVDFFAVCRDCENAILEREIADKRWLYKTFPEEGVGRFPLPEDMRREASLNDAAVLAVADLTRRLENHFGTIQEIEWLLDERHRPVLLKTLPLYLSKAAEMRFRPGLPEMTGGSEAAPLARGVAASLGVGAGPVHVVRRDADALNFPEGGVLVVAHPNPGWSALLPKAAAMIAEHAGVGGHLADIAREFAVPALFGVSGATTRFHEGQVVTVDAAAMTVWEGRQERLLAAAGRRKSLMAGSPIMETLAKVSREVLPLRLFDPDSPDFKAAHCQSLHDILYFAHEMAVREIFAVGQREPGARHAPKRLHGEVAMQFWVIDLEDGIKPNAVGPAADAVHLDDIVSEPMLALWKGMNAIPWEGPPAMDTKGFMAVLYEASANPDLDPAAKSLYALRNYFMISRHYCGLQFRFGFHLCAVETWVGDRPSENYITFRFKGGAADRSRRVRRTRFLGSILDTYGFRCDLSHDALTARREGGEAEDMLRDLILVGYVIMHSRQLDMVMTNEAELVRYRAKFERDLGSILGDEWGASAAAAQLR